MADYRIFFFNDIPDSMGHDHHACQRTIDISDVMNEQQTITGAVDLFERLENVSHWRLHAQMFE